MAPETTQPMPAVEPPAGMTLRQTLLGRGVELSQIGWSPDGRALAAGAEDPAVQVWNVEAGQTRSQRAHSQAIRSVAWSADGLFLASGSADRFICLLDGPTGNVLRILGEHADWINCLAWSPTRPTLATGSRDAAIFLWDLSQGPGKGMGKPFRTLAGHAHHVNALAWSPDGVSLASGSDDHTIRLWDVEAGTPRHTLAIPPECIFTLAWSPDGRLLASGGVDDTIHLWDPARGRQVQLLQGHASSVTSLSFSHDARLLASKSRDNSVRLWRRDTWDEVAVLAEKHSSLWNAGLAFHPTSPALATLGEDGSSIRVWDLDYDLLLGAAARMRSAHYANAKVVLVGESNAGKTCLVRALLGEPFQAQESTHGMKVWPLSTETVEQPEGVRVTHEVLLWDLAGQPEYQLVHQLFLDRTALGLVVFDPTDPKWASGGVGHWEKALRRAVGDDGPRLLVAGRVDRGHPTATQQDMKAFCREHGFLAFIATSAKTGAGIKKLRRLIATMVPWDRVPVTHSPELWWDMRRFLLLRRAGDDVLTRRSDLLGAFRAAHPSKAVADTEFDAVLGHAQDQGLVWRLSFGDLILLRPELVDDYASAVVRAARKHPKGLGCLPEQDVLQARIDFEDMKRLKDPAAERTLLHAVVELFLAREVALREGDQLVFPSKFNRKRPDYHKPPTREVVYQFAGTVEDIYATLVVRLFHCRAFDLKDLWQDAAELQSAGGVLCSFALRTLDGGHGEISVFFGERASLETKLLFLRFVHEHIQEHGLKGSVQRERVYRCPNPSCNWEVGDQAAVRRRLERGDQFIRCQGCEHDVPLVDPLEERFGDPDLVRRVRALDEEIDQRKGQEVAVSTVKGERQVGEFDVFLAHNNLDQPQVEAIAEELKRRGLNPWLDKEQVPPGRWIYDVLQQTIPRIKAAAVFFGHHGLGKWQTTELRALFRHCQEHGYPLIPVLLPGVTDMPLDVQPILQQLSLLRFPKDVHDVEALDRLEWGITGKKREPGR